MRSPLLAIALALFLVATARAEDVEWTPEANMDHQLFPSMIIATATVRPVEPDDKEAETPDPYLLGERFGLLGVSVKAPAENARVKVTIKENELMATSSWSAFSATTWRRSATSSKTLWPTCPVSPLRCAIPPKYFLNSNGAKRSF